MKFIREMITKKNRPTEMEEEQVEEKNSVLGDLEAQEPTDDELYSGIAAIQSLLDETPEALDEEELAELAELEAQDREDTAKSASGVVNFADLVSDIQKPRAETQLPVEPMAKAPEAETAQADAAPDIVPPDPVVAKVEDNTKTAAELATALGSGVTVTVRDRPISKHAVFDQTRFTSSVEPEGEEIVAPSVETPKEVATADAAPMEQVEIKTEPDAAARTPPRLLTPQTETKTPPVTASQAEEPAAQANIIEVPAPAAGRSGRRAGRVKTRLLGFNHGDEASNDPFDTKSSQVETTNASYPTGWIVIVDGPGRGASFTLYNGVSQIGRGDDQPIKLAFGDTSISRSNHAAIAYDDQEHKFFLGHGGKANLVRLNDRPVLSTEEIASNDLIRIGETTLRFVGFCGAHFDWDDGAPEETENVANA